jgi:malate dehydrogenase (oxaloacetate-decarboxylating)
VLAIAPSFGGINLEDISAPRCFSIERRLKEKLSIPVMHDDQHGTAIVVLAGGMNAAKVVGKNLKEIRIVIVGAGAAGAAIARLFYHYGVRAITVVDSAGIIGRSRSGITKEKMDLASFTNIEDKTGSLADALVGADMCIGVSGPGLIKPASKPGELEIQVMADPIDAFGQPIGERGNIKGEVKFFLPALSAENQKKIFATNVGDFSGGVTNVVKFISKEDTEAARAKMDSDLRASAEAELQAVVTKRNENQNTKLALLTGKNLIEFGTPNIIIPPNIEGQKLDSFDVKGSMVVSSVAYG